MNRDETLFRIDVEMVEERAGRPLTDEECERFEQAFRHTTVWDCIDGCLDSILDDPDAAFRCNTCDRVGTIEDGCYHGEECPDLDCDGTVHRLEDT